MSRAWILLATAGLCLLVRWGSAADRLDEILTELRWAGDRLQTLHAGFDQVDHDHILQEEERSTGRLYLKVPGRIRWEYEPPRAKVLLVKDEKILLYNPAARQVQEFEKGQVQGAGADLLVGFGQSNREIGKHYDVTLIEEQADQVVLKLVPKPQSSASIFASIDLTLDKERWIPVRTVFHELNRDTTTLVFRDVVLNQKLPKGIFELNLPSGVEVIRGH